MILLGLHTVHFFILFIFLYFVFYIELFTIFVVVDAQPTIESLTLYFNVTEKPIKELSL